MPETRSLVARAFSTDSEFTKEEVLDVLFYAKEIFGLVLGAIVAMVGLMGLQGLVTFVLAISLLIYLYVFKFLGVDQEVIEAKEVLKEHFMNGFFPFLLTWIVGYNLIHFT